VKTVRGFVFGRAKSWPRMHSSQSGLRALARSA
jgi:hypothetical protein